MTRPVVIITGLSGAGRASILNMLEDLSFETVDNPRSRCWRRCWAMATCRLPWGWIHARAGSTRRRC